MSNGDEGEVIILKWEYLTYPWNAAAVSDSHGNLVKDLNYLGQDGWEVINSVPTEFRGGDGITERTDTVVYLLKREVK